MREYEAEQRQMAEKRAWCPRAAGLADILREAYDLLLSRAYGANRAFSPEEEAVLSALFQIESGLSLGVEADRTVPAKVADLLNAAGLGHAFVEKLNPFLEEKR
jgi:hypothetical protein